MFFSSLETRHMGLSIHIWVAQIGAQLPNFKTELEVKASTLSREENKKEKG